MDNLEKDLLNLKNENIEVPKCVLNKVNLAFDEIRKRNGNEDKNSFDERGDYGINLENKKNSKYELNRNLNLDDKLERWSKDKENLGAGFKAYNIVGGNLVNSSDKKKKQENIERRKPNKRRYVGIASGLALVTLVGLSTPVRGAINKLFFNNSGIESAINNNYIQKISDKGISYNDFNINLKKVLVDSSKIILDFEIEVKDAKKLLNLDQDKIDTECNLELYDEKGDVIEKDGVLGPISDLEYSISKDNLEDNKINLITMFNSNRGKIPTMNKMKVKFKSLSFRNEKGNLIYEKNLNWNFNVNLDEKFKQHKDIIYSYKNESPNNIVIHEAKAVPTGLFIDLDYLPRGYYENLLLKMKIKDKNGNIYKMNGCNMESLDNGGDRVKGTFEGISSFDNADEFTLEIENPDGKTIDKVNFFRK